MACDPSAPTAPLHAGPILYFDGECGLCNRWVNLLLSADVRGTLRFAPLQGPTAAERLPPALVAEVHTLVLEAEGRTLLRSTAVLHALGYLGGIWRLAAVLRVVPRPLRDAAYDFIARHRFRWFGRLPTCRIPTPAERARFLP
jgi:predicted DCC family thiol-disulfide oxidoreductase YuxK